MHGKRTLGIVGAALLAGAVVIVGSAGPSTAGPAQPHLQATPGTVTVGQTVTVAPADATGACNGASVDLQYFREDGAEMDKTITLDPNDAGDDMWSDHIAFDAAGFYSADATCNALPVVNAVAGHRSVSGETTPIGYQPADIEVIAEITSSPEPATVGQTITFAPKAGSECPSGVVALTITNPDATATVPLAPTVDGAGAWSVAMAFATPGTYSINGTCDQGMTTQNNAGHRAVEGRIIHFDYVDHVFHVVAAAVPETPPATPVVAAANFTG
jgi:hypothetical protein